MPVSIVLTFRLELFFCYELLMSHFFASTKMLVKTFWVCVRFLMYVFLGKNLFRISGTYDLCRIMWSMNILLMRQLFVVFNIFLRKLDFKDKIFQEIFDIFPWETAKDSWYDDFKASKKILSSVLYTSPSYWICSVFLKRINLSCPGIPTQMPCVKTGNSCSITKFRWLFFLLGT